MGRKSRSALSAKTNPAILDAAKSRLLQQIQKLQQ